MGAGEDFGATAMMPSDLTFWAVEERAIDEEYILTCGAVSVAVEGLHSFWEVNVVPPCHAVWPNFVSGSGSLQCRACMEPLPYPEGTLGRIFRLSVTPHPDRESVEAWLAGKVDPLLAALAVEELLALLEVAKEGQW